MNISKIIESHFGYSVTIVTISGNKIQGTILRNDEDIDSLKVKTEDGIIIVNSDAIESIY
jgi:hypothetical protein